jgi:hypothetical protein
MEVPRAASATRLGYDCYAARGPPISYGNQHHIARIHLLESPCPITSAGDGFHRRRRLRVEDLAAAPFSQLGDRLICGIHLILRLRQQSLKSGHLWVVYKTPTFGCRQTSGMRGSYDSRTTRQGQARKEGRSSGPGPLYRLATEVVISRDYPTKRTLSCDLSRG